MSINRRRLDRFPQVHVSEHFHRHVKALEAAATAVGEASTPDEIHKAYSALTLAREALYSYVAFLEARDRAIERPIALRF